MGVFDFLKTLVQPSDKKSARPHAATPTLKPLRRQRKLAAKRSFVKTKPYAMAVHDGSSYHDMRVGGSLERLTRFKLPNFATPEELAAWLKVPLKQLSWFGDYHRNNAEAGARTKLSHYHYVWVKKRSGGHRLIEAPKALLKEIQSRFLREILDHVPAHTAAHGFVKGRSILTNAAQHAGKYVIVKADLADFYPSVKQSRVVSIFRGVGYNLEVSRWLARLCTNRAPRSLRPPEAAVIPTALFRPHLPQGAPTSPALANLAAFGLDVRLSGLAKKFGVTYTRYADDVVFSGPEELLSKGRMAKLITFVKQIIRSERFTLNAKKLRVIRRGDRQEVTGLTVNKKPNVTRPRFDTLKAILNNCARKGPASQNRDGHEDFRAHLIGQISFVRGVNSAKAARLQKVFDRIAWN